MNRRSFLYSGALLSLSPLLADAAGTRNLKTVGIQFFSLPFLLEKDLEKALDLLSNIGYREVELYGPYSFSMPAAQRSWAAVTPALGFSGSGFFGKTTLDMKSLLKKYHFSVPSMHTDLDTLEQAMGPLAETANTLGSTYVVLPAIPDGLRRNLDDYKKMADRFNQIGAAAKKQGIRFAYHNHGYGLAPMEGKIPLELIQASTDPDTVFFEMDLFWTTAGGADPIALLEKNKGRYRLMHVKDMDAAVRFSGDGGNATQWIELFPHMTTAGNGVLDLKTILPRAKALGVKHFIVEQDMVKDPESALRKSYDYLAGLNF